MAFIPVGLRVPSQNGTKGAAYQSTRCASTVRMAENSAEISRRQLLAGTAAVLAGVSVGATPAFADRDLMGAKRSYFRYVPRVETGIDFYVQDLYPEIQKADWKAVLQAYEPKSDARDGSKKAEYGIDRKVSDLQRYLFDPLTIFAQSFAEKGTGPNYRFLASKEQDLEKQMARLKKIADGDNLSFSKENDGLNREDAALDAWEKGRVILNEYFTLANKNLSRELRKLDLIPENVSEYKPHNDRPKAYGTFQ